MSARSGDLLHRLRGLTEGRGQIAHIESLEARPARFGALAHPLSDRLQRQLGQEGIDRLFTHQAQAIDRVRQGDHVVVVTGTASGKSLCYHIPLLESLEEDPSSRALLLFPTKALAQDQLKVLRRLQDEADDARAPRTGTYDGDTPTNLRNRLRDEANLLLTNPDMLHSGILPHHARWSGFFSRLQYVVVDEIHVYRGIFGSHVANVLRRLRRIARHYGADPIFICASATIANPGELASRLLGLPVTVIDDDGSPRGRKHFVFWNPPRMGEIAMERRSSNLEARDLMVELIKDGYQTIAFVKARLLTEVLLRYCQEALREAGGGLAAKLRAYRAGYLASERRQIEAALFAGELRGVISTNALELGIDVGSLDAALLVGYPGTIASTWQQAGRAGRRQGRSVAILIPDTTLQSVT
ncbi:MAG: DEAD/DEAH box helicase [Candidatus Eisenbacteria bacterium]